MDMSVTQLREMTKRLKEKHVLPPAHWGDTRHHVFYGALYHWFVMFANLRFPNFTPHRKTTAAQEFKWHLRRLYRRPFSQPFTVESKPEGVAAFCAISPSYAAIGA